MPPIKDSQEVLQTSSEEKVQILQEAFFPKPPVADLADIQGYQYPRVDMPEDITTQEIEAVLQRVSVKKAPGPDEIPNSILQLLGPTLIQELTRVFNSCLRLGYYPKHLRDSITVILQKPQKDNYTAAK